MRIALYQPEIAGNLGTILRLGACLGVPVDVIGPCGFPLGDRGLRRSGMDYIEIAALTLHADWTAFRAATRGRLVLFTTRAASPLPEMTFHPDDVLLFGSEGGGVPEPVRAAADQAVRIPVAAGTRSLNLAVAAGMGLGEALRQTDGWPR